MIIQQTQRAIDAALIVNKAQTKKQDKSIASAAIEIANINSTEDMPQVERLNIISGDLPPKGIREDIPRIETEQQTDSTSKAIIDKTPEEHKETIQEQEYNEDEDTYENKTEQQTIIKKKNTNNKKIYFIIGIVTIAICCCLYITKKIM